MYNEGETTHFNQPLIQCNIKRCWNECLERADYNNRRKDIDIFNRFFDNFIMKTAFIIIWVVS